MFVAGLATPDEMAATDAFNDRLQAEGHWVFGGGLGAPSTATVIDNRGGGGEGYLATGPGTDPVRRDLTAEAIRLTRLIRALMPQDGEVAGLLALMLLTEARRAARVSASGDLVTLDEQDRGPGTRRWSPRVIGWCASAWPPGGSGSLPDPRGDQRRPHLRPRHTRHRLVAGPRALRPARPPRPSPIIALNRAIAVAAVDGPEVALADRLEGKLAGNTAETAYLTRRRGQLG